MCSCLGKPVTWSKFKILSYLYQLKAYELRMKTQYKLWQAWWQQWFGMERKALQIHNLYIVVIKGTKNLLHSLRSCHSPWRHWSAPCVKSGESPQSVHSVRESIFRLPGNNSENQSRVEYTSLELHQIALEHIRVLPARLDRLHPILTAQSSPYSAITLPKIFGQKFHYHNHPSV
jgi:hypothetical protein